MNLEVKIRNESANPLPQYATHGSSGLDLRASLDAPLTLQPMDRTLVPTGLFMEIPEGYEAQVRPRSGLAAKHGITCLNTPGTIDSDYRGEIKIILINLYTEAHIIEPGVRLAQMVFQKVENVEWAEVSLLIESQRNEGGFGSTGKE